MYVWYDLHILYMDYPTGVVTTHSCELFHMQIYAHLVGVPADEFRSAGEIAEFRVTFGWQRFPRIVGELHISYLEPVCPLFWGLNPKTPSFPITPRVIWVPGIYKNHRFVGYMFSYVRLPRFFFDGIRTSLCSRWCFSWGLDRDGSITDPPYHSTLTQSPFFFPETIYPTTTWRIGVSKGLRFWWNWHPKGPNL